MAQVQVEHRQLIVKDEIWDIYYENGARMINAFTANDLTAYVAALPANRLELWMMLESDRMKNAIFREFYSERDVVAEERRLGENDPDEALLEVLLSTAYEASPYRRPIWGWMSDVQSMTMDELQSYYKRYYAPNNATVLLIGDVNVDEARRLATKYFGRMRRQRPPDPVEVKEPRQKGERRVAVELPANPKILIAYHVPTYPHPDRYTVHAMSLVLGQGRTSRLYKKIYEELQLTSTPPRVSMEPGERFDPLLIIEATPRHPHSAEEVEKAIYDEIQVLTEDPPTAREMQRIRNMIDAQMVRSLGSNWGIAFDIGMKAFVRGDWRAYLDDAEGVKAVQAEGVSYAAGTYLIPENRTVATLVKVEEQRKPAAEGAEEEIDMKALIQFVRSLPAEEQKAIFQKIQTMNDEQRKAFAGELMMRMKSQSK